MAPSILQEFVDADPISNGIAFKSKVKTLNHDNVPKPVADDFMYDFKYNHPLPTTDILGVEIPMDCDAQREAEGIVARLSKAASDEDAEAFAGLFLDYGETLRKTNPTHQVELTLNVQVCGVTSFHSPGTSALSTSEITS